MLEFPDEDDEEDDEEEEEEGSFIEDEAASGPEPPVPPPPPNMLIACAMAAISRALLPPPPPIMSPPPPPRSAANPIKWYIVNLQFFINPQIISFLSIYAYWVFGMIHVLHFHVVLSTLVKGYIQLTCGETQMNNLIDYSINVYAFPLTVLYF